MSERVSDLRLFARVIRTGSLSRAGREVGLTQSAVSRTIVRLEKDVGASLLMRTTRAVQPTDAGAEYLARIEPILAALDEANQTARGTGELRGVLRVGTVSGFAIRELVPRLPAFMQAHPALRIEFLMDDKRQDLVGENVDIAVRFGQLEDSTATAKFLGWNPKLLLASPAYLERAGTPTSPADLENHAIVMGPAGQARDAWRLKRGEVEITPSIERFVSFTVSDAAIAAAREGLGIVSAVGWSCRAEVAAGDLVRVLPEWGLAPTAAHAVFPAGRAAKLAARVFADFLAEVCKGFQ
jgi:DNA-binding transcriptional LysR family regulator